MTRLVARTQLQSHVLAHRRRRPVRSWLVALFLAELGPVLAFCNSMSYDCLLERALNAFRDLVD